MLDLVDAFGPLAGMHAALDKAGAGMPCGVAARFPGVEAVALEEAVARAAARFPVLGRRLAWRGERPILVADAPIAPSAQPVSLDLTVDEDGGWWRWRVVEEAGGAWLTAAWAHVASDGLSMLRLLRAVRAELEGREDGSPLEEVPPRGLQRTPRMAAWTPSLVRDHFRVYLRPRPAAATPCGASWLLTSAEARDRVIAQARAACGSVASWIAAAGALSLADGRSGEVKLNLPIARDPLAAASGFGFGVGSLIQPVRLWPGATLDAVAPRIARRTRRMAEIGWDGALRRFIGDDPARHARFAAVRVKGRPDPTLTVSWKGRVSGFQGMRDIACFAAAPTAHLSAHADEQGLSLSLSAPVPREVREARLRDVAARLGLSSDLPVFDLDRLGGEPGR